MAWIALDCALPEHPKIASLPSDAVRYGWVLTLLAAKRQRQPGRFASARHYREVMHRHAKYLPLYLEARLLEEVDGALIVHDWQQYQWAAAKARQREDTNETKEGQEKDSRARNAVTVPPEGVTTVNATEEGVQGEKPRQLPSLAVRNMDGTVTEVAPAADLPADSPRLQRLAEELTGQPYAMANLYAGLGQKAINEQLRPHRWSRTEKAWRQVAARFSAESGVRPTLRQLILGADDLLNPIPQGLDKEAHEAEEQARYDRRVAATERRLEDMRSA